jgi:hypothetical protein
MRLTTALKASIVAKPIAYRKGIKLSGWKLYANSIIQDPLFGIMFTLSDMDQVRIIFEFMKT